MGKPPDSRTSPRRFDAEALGTDAGGVTDAMNVRLDGPDGAVLVVRLPERLTHDTSSEVRLAVERGLPNRDGAGLVLDMGDVSLVTSLGVATLLQIQEFCRDRGAPMRVAGLSLRLGNFFEMLGLEDKFDLSDTVDEALVLLGG